ncbi:hypothetical protein BH09BAC1_BH09BAC1_22590 [soil metagenome]
MKCMVRVYFWMVSMLCASNLWCQNVLISDFDNPNEPCIMIDPIRPNVLMAAANLNYYFVSTDTGRTWTVEALTSPYGVWGDPVMVVDTTSSFYFFHLSNPPGGNWIDRIVCQKTTDDGAIWSPGTFTGLNGAKAQDKQWAVVDRSNNYVYLTWTQFDDYGSSNPTDSSIILFSRSMDGGDNWSAPLRLNTRAGDCIDSDTTVEGAMPAVGPNGEVYVAWAAVEGLVFNRSLDNGNTWLPMEIPIDPMPGGWDYYIPGLSRANGLPVLLCDLSSGPRRGTLYLNWTDQRNGTNDTDVWFSKSTDGGDTWSPATRVNDDAPGKHQFLTWMAIDQTTGYLYFVFYDRRAYNDDATDVYMATSKDGGATFVNERISESPFIPLSGVFFGDYTNITAHQGIVRPIWSRMDTGSTSVWTHLYPLTTDTMVGMQSITDPIVFELAQNFPNPATDKTYISFKLHETAQVNLSIYNIFGQEIIRPLQNATMDYGKQVIPIDLAALQLAPGIYYYQLTVNHQTMTKRIVVE